MLSIPLINCPNGVCKNEINERGQMIDIVLVRSLHDMTSIAFSYT